jgi:hypothetical protein
MERFLTPLAVENAESCRAVGPVWIVTVSSVWSNYVQGLTFSMTDLILAPPETETFFPSASQSVGMPFLS